VIATAMSTIDSYLLIAGGNLTYDMYRPLVRLNIDDASLLRLARAGVVIASIATVAFALFFTSMVSAWVFMSSMLVSTALVPIVAALFLRVPPKPAAVLASSLTGLAVAVIVFVLTNINGVYDDEWGTRIWSFAVDGRSISIWQEYAVLFALPASVVAFLIGQVVGRTRARVVSSGAGGGV
jgi:Na+/proline symporter